MKNTENELWNCTSVILDGEDFKIEGLNIWDYESEPTKRKITVKDPVYNNLFIANVYNIQQDSVSIEFAAIEFSNNVWEIFEKELKKSR